RSALDVLGYSPRHGIAFNDLTWSASARSFAVRALPGVAGRVNKVDRIPLTVLVRVLTEIRIAADEDPDLRVVVTCPDVHQTGVAVVSVSDHPPIAEWQA